MVLMEKRRPPAEHSSVPRCASALSSLIFCTKKGPVVKTTGREKVRNLSEKVESVYVNSECINLFHPPVENPC